ncbi:MAG: hypothetical protein JXR53_15665 [Bacteroidales bacterium]|nr:hypothetical protein [Bacteroidales bacterium]
MSKIVVYPNPRKHAENSYIQDLCDSVDAINKNENLGPNILNLINHLFDGDAYIFNWPENVAFRKFGVIQFFVMLLCLMILRVRQVTFLWIFHNIEPHQGHNIYSKLIFKLFFRISSFIIPHSKDAFDFLQGKTNAQVVYYPHPFHSEFKSVQVSSDIDLDVIIWGNISKYKGIAEYVAYKRQYCNDTFKTLIVGRCSDLLYDESIRNHLDDYTTYQNRFLCKDELNILIRKSKYVLFPYVKGSVSSSGALMDSILLGKTVIGPDVGAFREMAEEGFCFTFKSYDEIFQIISSGAQIDILLLEKYVNENTWYKFGTRLVDIIESKKIHI